MAIPQNLSSLVVYFNTEMFEEAGIPEPTSGWTWDDFTSAAKALTVDTDGDGFPEIHGVTFDPTIHRYAAAIWGAGGELFDDVYQPTRLTLDTPEARRGSSSSRRWVRLGLARRRPRRIDCCSTIPSDSAADRQPC